MKINQVTLINKKDLESLVNTLGITLELIDKGYVSAANETIKILKTNIEKNIEGDIK